MRWILSHASLITFSCALFFASPSFAAITLADLQQQIPQMNWQALEKGEIIWQPLPRAELDDSALVTITAVKLAVDKDSAVKQLYRYNNEILTLPIDATSQTSARKSLEKFQIAARAEINLDWFSQPKDDGSYNVSREEFTALKDNASTLNPHNPRQARQQIEHIIQQLLSQRVMAYREQGITGIAPYIVQGKTIHPSDYLANSLAALSLLEEKEPSFYQAFSHYPKNAQAEFIHQFYLGMEMDGRRPITYLKHWMIDDQPQRTLIAERKFYISHSLEAMHTLILVMEHNNSSYVFLLNQTFTEKVTGIGSFIAHKVGRKKVKENIMPMFEHLQQEMRFVAEK